MYYRIGNSKKAAKLKAASKALKSFIQFPTNGTSFAKKTAPGTRLDFISDQVINKKNGNIVINNEQST
ncbi:unnamed protein product [Diabrotica balteata]|uniref:Uncharacterized protein n=1 Tax=Diabrotica balteata TaxID=107213 RepID=A0A9N9T7T5_DIABA|nr:unnamed protein product [Diabrotica balteata]